MQHIKLIDVEAKPKCCERPTVDAAGTNNNSNIVVFIMRYVHGTCNRGKSLRLYCKQKRRRNLQLLIIKLPFLSEKQLFLTDCVVVNLRVSVSYTRLFYFNIRVNNVCFSRIFNYEWGYNMRKYSNAKMLYPETYYLHIINFKSI